MPNFKCPMPNQIKNPNVKRYDLEERTALLGEKLLEFLNSLPRNPINDVLIKQCAEAGTSIGANYMEADGAESK